MAPLLVVTVLNFVSVPLFYRYLGAELYAIWFYVQTLSGSFGFIDLGIGTAISRYMGVALGKGDREAAIEYWATGNATALPFLISFGALFTILGSTLGPAWFNVPSEQEALLKHCFLAGGIALVLAYYNQFWNVLSQVHLDFRFVSLTRVGTTTLQLIPCIILARLTRNPLILIAWTTIVAALQLLIFIFHSRVRYGIGLSLRQASFARLREMSTYTGKALATLIINCVFTPVDRLIAGRLAAPATFTHYTIASNLGARASSFGFAAVAPVFANTSLSGGEVKSRSAAIYNEAFRFLSSWYILGVVWIVVWRQPVCRIWLGPETGAAVASLLPPLLIAYAITGISMISSAQLGALNRLGTQAIFHLAAGLVTIPAIYIGWNAGGPIGLAYGYALSRLPLVIQDLYLLKMIGAGGWLESATWLDIFAQTGIGIIFFLLSNSLGLSTPGAIALAILHGGLVGLWLIRQNVLRR
jgi:O-antigen/teichoic acid export membrane protein